MSWLPGHVNAQLGLNTIDNEKGGRNAVSPFLIDQVRRFQPLQPMRPMPSISTRISGVARAAT